MILKYNYFKLLINLIESLNYEVMYCTGSCTHWLLYTYSREKCIHSIVLISLKLLVCHSSCH